MTASISTAAPPVGLPLGRILIAIAGIYTAQSLVGGLTFQGIPAILRANGVALDMIGLVSFAMLPWALKFLWAPIVERYRLPVGTARRSRRIIVVGELLVAGALLLLSAIGSADYAILLLMLGVVALASATVDIACDAFAIEQLPPSRRGWGNTAQVGGGYFGIMFGSGLFVILVAQAGWTAACAAMALIVLCLAMPFAMTREPDRPASAAVAHRPSLSFAFARPAVRLGLLLTILFQVGARFAQGMIYPFLVDSGLSLTAIGALSGVGGVVAGLIGTLVGGLLVRGLGSRQAVIVAAIGQAMMLAALAATVTVGVKDPAVLIGVVILNTVVTALGFVTLYTVLMGLSSLLQAGVDFTLFQCADALVAGLLGFGGSVVAQHFGFGPCFSVAAGLSVAMAVSLPPILRRLATYDGTSLT